MSATTTKLNGAVQSQAEKIVTSGGNIRPQLAEIVTQNACKSEQFGGGLVGLIRSVIDGAQAGLAKAVPKDRDDVLRQVVDALGDGVSQTALAGQLAVQEAVSASRQFAKQDLSRFREDLTAVRDLFSETVERGLSAGKTLTTAQVSAATTHARHVAERMGPAVRQALDAIRQHPVAFAQEGLAASVSAGQSAAGSLFQAFGRMLQRAGEQLQQPVKPEK